MELNSKEYQVYKNIDFANRYEILSNNFQFQDRLDYANDEVLNLISKLGYKARYIKSNNFFKVEDKQEFQIPIIVPFDDLQDFVLQIDENAGKYLKNIRSSIRGYGPKHSKIFKVMQEENFDLEPFIYQYFQK